MILHRPAGMGRGLSPLCTANPCGMLDASVSFHADQAAAADMCSEPQKAYAPAPLSNRLSQLLAPIDSVGAAAGVRVQCCRFWDVTRFAGGTAEANGGGDC